MQAVLSQPAETREAVMDGVVPEAAQEGHARHGREEEAPDVQQALLKVYRGGVAGGDPEEEDGEDGGARRSPRGGVARDQREDQEDEGREEGEEGRDREDFQGAREAGDTGSSAQGSEDGRRWQALRMP